MGEEENGRVGIFKEEGDKMAKKKSSLERRGNKGNLKGMKRKKKRIGQQREKLDGDKRATNEMGGGLKKSRTGQEMG